MLRASGRLKDLEKLTDLVAKSTRGRVLAFHGGSALDQAELVSELRAELNREGLVLEGSCARGSSGPFRPFQAIVRQLAQAGPEACDAARLDALVNGALSANDHSDARAVLDLVRNQDGRLNHFESVRRMLCEAASRQRLLVAIHDLQSADEDTLALVDYLIEDVVGNYDALGIASPAANRPVYLLTVDDDCPAGRQILDRLRGFGHVHVIAVERLDAEGLGRLLSRAEFAEKLLRITDGMAHKAKMLVEVLPEDLDTLVRARLHELDAEELGALQLARVFERPVGIGALAVMGQVPRATIRSLWDAGFLAESGVVRGREPTLQIAAAYADSSMLQTADLSQLAAYNSVCAEHLTALHSVSGDQSLHEAIARHRLAANQVDEAVPDVLAAALWLRGQGALGRSVELLRETVQSGPSQVNELTVALIDAELAMGHHKEALDLCKQLAASTDFSLLLRTARIHEMSGDLEAAEKALRKLQNKKNIQDDLRQVVTSELAECLVRRGDLDGAETLCHTQLAKPETTEPSLVRALTHTLGKVAFWRTQWDVAQDHYEEVLRGLPAQGEEVERGRVLHNMGLVGLRTGRYGAACQRIQQALGILEGVGEYFQATVCRHNLAIAHECRQNYGMAVQLFEQCIEDFDRLGKMANLAGALNSLGDLYVALGDSWRARKLIEQSSQTAVENGLGYMVAFNQLRMGQIELLDGRHAEAHPLAEAACDAFNATGHSDELAEAHLLLARVLKLEGQSVEALDSIAKSEECGGRETVARAWILKAQLVRENEPATAFRLADEASHVLRAAGQRAGVVEALTEAAMAARQAGQTDEAKSLLDRANDGLSDLRERVPATCKEAFEALPFVCALKTEQPASSESLDVALVQPQDNVVSLSAPRAKKKSRPDANQYHGMIGRSPQIQHVFEMIHRLADAEAPILITGESGTGKELVAAAIRAESRRSNRPFVRVNAAAFVDTLLESELFGHEKGAFTGAVACKLGAFEQANGGTLFLDEIGDITAKTQVSLLRVLQEREIRRVGGRRPLKVDVRIICATNRDLDAMVADGTFRLDLYYRIKGLTILLPPLRDRGDDLDLICDHILLSLSEKHGRRLELAPDAQALLRRYRWPGNVRELENVLRSVYFFADNDQITANELVTYTLLREATNEDMVHTVATGDANDDAPLADGFDLAQAKRTLEIRCIEKALRQTAGNITKAAGLLSMKRPRLSQKIKEYGLKIRNKGE